MKKNNKYNQQYGRKKLVASILSASVLFSMLAGCSNVEKYVRTNSGNSTKPSTSSTESIVNTNLNPTMDSSNVTIDTNITSPTQDSSTLQTPDTVQNTEETQVLEINFNADDERNFSSWLKFSFGMTYWEFVSTFSVNDVLPYAVEYINEKKLSNIPVTIDDISLDTLNNMVHYIKSDTACSIHSIDIDSSMDQHIENINFRFFDYGTLSMGTLEFNILYKILIENNIPFGEQIPKDVILKYADFYDETYTTVYNKLVDFAYNKPNEITNDYIACICIDWNRHIALYSIQIDNWSLKVSDSEIFTEALNSSIDLHFENNGPHVGEQVSIDWYNNTFDDTIDLTTITYMPYETESFETYEYIEPTETTRSH